MAQARDTYKYWFKVGNLKVKCGSTKNLKVREGQHRRSGKYTVHNEKRFYWMDGKIVKEGNVTTKRAALDWEREHNCNK